MATFLGDVNWFTIQNLSLVKVQQRVLQAFNNLKLFVSELTWEMKWTSNKNQVGKCGQGAPVVVCRER